MQRLVAEYFLGGYVDTLQVNHINCVKTDNRVENLELITASENIRHAHDNKRMLKRAKTVVNFLSQALVEESYLRIRKGETISEVGRQLGIPRTTLSSILNKRSHKEFTDKLDKINFIPQIQHQNQ